jgi:hypothetical protein
LIGLVEGGLELDDGLIEVNGEVPVAVVVLGESQSVESLVVGEIKSKDFLIPLLLLLVIGLEHVPQGQLVIAR